MALVIDAISFKLPHSQQYLVSVIATDGFNTAEDVSDAVFTVVASDEDVYLPIILKNSN